MGEEMPKTLIANGRDVKLSMLYEAMQKLQQTMNASVETGFKVIICGKV